MSTKIRKVVADFETQLATAIAVGATSFTLASATDDDGNLLADGTYCFTVDKGASNKEYLIGSLDASTKIVTSVKNITRQGTESSGANSKHRVGANVSITNFAVLLDLAKQLGGEDTLDADSPLSYDAEPTLSSREEIATVAYVLDNVNGGTVSVARIVHPGNAGETVAAGDIVYFDTSDLEWKLADADTQYSDDIQFGIAQGAGTDGNTITGGVLLRGFDENQTGLTGGTSYYISQTAGDLTSTAPTNDIFVGVAVSATTLLVNFENRITDFINSDNITQSAVLQEQTTNTNSYEVGEADTTTNKRRIAQSFVASKTKMRGVNLWKKADTGSFTGDVKISLQADNSGAPSGTDLATVTISNADWLALTDDAQFEALFDSEYTSLVVGDTYWTEVEPTTADNSNHINLGADTSTGSGGAYYNNTTDGWTQSANTDIYFQVLEGNESQVVKTKSDGKISKTLIDLPSCLIGNHNSGSLTEGGTVQSVLSHNLGSVPRLLRVYSMYRENGNQAVVTIMGSFDGTNQRCESTYLGGTTAYERSSGSKIFISGNADDFNNNDMLEVTVTGWDENSIYFDWSLDSSSSKYNTGSTENFNFEIIT